MSVFAVPGGGRESRASTSAKRNATRVPSFAVGCADRYEPIDEGWAPRPIPGFDGDAAFGWHLLDTMVENQFDPMIVQGI